MLFKKKKEVEERRQAECHKGKKRVPTHSPGPGPYLKLGFSFGYYSLSANVFTEQYWPDFKG